MQAAIHHHLAWIVSPSNQEAGGILPATLVRTWRLESCAALPTRWSTSEVCHESIARGEGMIGTTNSAPTFRTLRFHHGASTICDEVWVASSAGASVREI
eukprot:6458871-Amphidinium_carterae.2